MTERRAGLRDPGVRRVEYFTGRFESNSGAFFFFKSICFQQVMSLVIVLLTPSRLRRTVLTRRRFHTNSHFQVKGSERLWQRAAVVRMMFRFGCFLPGCMRIYCWNPLFVTFSVTFFVR